MKKGKMRFALVVLLLAFLLGENITAAAPAQIAKAGGTQKTLETASTENTGKDRLIRCNVNKKERLWDDIDFDDDYAYVSDLWDENYSATSLTLSWYGYGKIEGFHIYRSSDYEKDYTKIGSVKSNGDGKYTFTDKGFKRGIRFYYAVVAYSYDTDGNETELGYVEGGYLLELPKTTLSSATRSGKKAVLKWKKVSSVSGYEIYKKASGSSYKKVKTINGNTTLSTTLSNLSTKKQYNFKVRAFIKYKGNMVYGSFGNEKIIYAKTDQKLAAKFKKLQKRFPNGRYWNHVGKKKYNSNTITSKPCHHASLNDLRTCNHYNCPNGILGYQCYGFAWKMSDLLYGRSAKIKNFTGFSKCRMGDVVRYSGHSIIIVEKHSDYVIAGECNYGNTCIIKWGRVVPNFELTGATYSRRYR